MTSLVYLDTETFGLDLDIHQIWEVGFAVGDEPVRSGVMIHNPLGAYEEAALKVNGYRHRGTAWDSDTAVALETALWVALRGSTVVGANPMFDLIRLQRRWEHATFESPAPWHYRTIDIESYVMPLLNLDRPIGLHGIATSMRSLDPDIPMPDHTAGGDVECLRACHKAAKRSYDRMLVR